MLYRISQFIGKLILTLYFRIRVEDRENIPKEGAHIVVANHTSFLDPFIIGTIVPRVIHYLTYAYFYNLPVCHWYCKRVHCIPLKKDGKDISALKNALRLLREGELLGIFPEGVRSATGQLGQGEPGVALIALKANVPILPIGIRGAYESFPKGAKFPKPGTITVTIGKPFRLMDELPVNTQTNDELHQQATDMIIVKIGEVCGLKGEFAQKVVVPIE
jgi:1-acyl-sn-glycerol-3-phosphate acyltransferase